MVIRLNRPEVEDEALIEAIIEQRQNGPNRTFFRGVCDEWKGRVRTYVEVGGDPEALPPWPLVADAAVKTRFLTLYNSPQDDSVQKPVLEELRARTLQHCPACGEFGTPNTLDHYLPKNRFPEFAVTAANLFPMCDTCQGWKGQKALNTNGERLFLHPYFDAFLDAQVIQLVIGEPYGAPVSMHLRAHVDLDEELRSLVARHLQSLNIATRYYHFFRDEYIHLLASAREIREEGLDMQQMLGLFRNKERRKSVNSWGHVFYDAVLQNEALMTYLETADLAIQEE